MLDPAPPLAFSEAVALANSSREQLRELKRRAGHAIASQAKGGGAALVWPEDHGFAAVHRIGVALARLPPRRLRRVRLLVLFPVCNRPAVRDSLRAAVAALEPSDFSVFHYDSADASSPQYRAFAAVASWYISSPRIVHRSFRTLNSSCINIGWVYLRPLGPNPQSWGRAR